MPQPSSLSLQSHYPVYDFIDVSIDKRMVNAQNAGEGHSRKDVRMATTVRIDERVAAKLRDLASEEHRPIGQVIRDAVDQYQKEKFWREVEASVARLRADPVAWQEYQEEIRFYEGGSMDGLEDEEPYYTETEVEEILGRQART